MMLGSLVGGEVLEIVVALRDLSEAGFRKLETNIGAVETKAKTANFSPFSSKTKTLETDAEHAAGGGGNKGGGLGALLAGFTGLPGPIALAGIAVAGFGALTATTVPVYEKVAKQQKALETAARDHGIALDALHDSTEAAIKAGEQYAYTADDVRAALTKATEAGLTLQQQQDALPHIMDLARAKNLDLAEATRVYVLALAGNTRGLKDLGIALPKVTTAEADHEKATKKVTSASSALKTAQEHLTLVEDQLKGKHSLTATQADRLRIAHEKVKTASANLKLAQDHLNKTQDDAAKKADRLRLINEDLTGSIGDQKGSITGLDQRQATLSNKWEEFATKVGPALENMLLGIVTALGAIVDALMWVVDHLPTIKAESASELSYYNPDGSVKYAKSAKGHAAGGWVGLRGPELAMLGEKGPEFVTSTGHLPQGGGGSRHVHHTHVHLNGREIAQVVDDEFGRILPLVGSTSMYG